MLLTIEKILTEPDLDWFNTALQKASWEDGAASAGALAKQVKNNHQIQDNTELAKQMRQLVLQRLNDSSKFVASVLPNVIFPPKFNRYGVGETYGTHVDSAVMWNVELGKRMRCDVSATLFLSDADQYEGGELEIETHYGVQSVKLNAGDLVVYPSSSLHQVKPVLQGTRYACFFWVQSIVQDLVVRENLFELDQSIQMLRQQGKATAPLVLRLTGVYHNLLRNACTL